MNIWKRQRRGNRRIVACMADMHSGSRLGLLNPDVVLYRQTEDGEDEPWTPELTATQRYLWDTYQGQLDQLRDLADGDDVVVLHVGDATQGERWNTLIPDVTRTDQRTIACANFEPLLSWHNVSRLRIVTGTEVHVPEAAEMRIAVKLRESTGKDVGCLHHSRLSVDGVVFDVAHHGPHPGSRDWLRGNVAQLYLRDRMARDRRLGKHPARVYVRGHYHVWVHRAEYQMWEGQVSASDLTILPAYAVPGWFWRKIGKSDPELYVGLVAYEVKDGQLVAIHPFVECSDLRGEAEL